MRVNVCEVFKLIIQTFICASLEKGKAHFYVDFGESFSQVINFLTVQR